MSDMIFHLFSFIADIAFRKKLDLYERIILGLLLLTFGTIILLIIFLGLTRK